MHKMRDFPFGCKGFPIDIHYDNRGYLQEPWNEETMSKLPHFVRDMACVSVGGALRGVHTHPLSWKLTKVVQGTVWQVLVALDKRRDTFGQHFAYLRTVNDPAVLIPPWVGNAFLTTSPEGAVYLYKLTTHYSPEVEFSVQWNDPELNITWPDKTPILSTRDLEAMPLSKFIIAQQLWWESRMRKSYEE